jgi:hypothetical protein
MGMPQAFSRYVPHVVECLASNYIDYNPIPLIKVRSCFGAHRWGGVSEVYSGLKYGIELGYIEAVPYGRLTRYKPTLIGTVKSAIMDAVMKALGIMDGRVIDATERVSIILYSNLLLDIPILITQRGLGGFGYKRVGDRVYLGMIALKVLAGVEVRGVKPRDYWQLFRFVREEALFHLMHGFRGFDPEAGARAIPFITLFLFRFDRELFVPRSKVKQFAMRLLRQWQLSN